GQVNLDGVTPDIDSQRRVIVNRADTGAVDQVINRSELVGLFDKVFDVVGVGNVALHEHDFAPQLLDGGSRLACFALARGIAEGNVRSLAGQPQGSCPPDATRSASDQDNTVSKLSGH